MTYIKKMKMHGFKSFAKPTELPFSKDFSVVIGPNGSGKSNIGDGLSFVLGRLSSKSMRAENAASLIYNGGKKGNPAKEAYVSITFDNSNNYFPVKSKEIEIKRLVRKNGQSKYFINGELRTRQQILDLLAMGKVNPDGHNIIFQGDIVHAAEMAPQERKEIIEEISGISTYEDKKGKAINELEKVESQLKEVNIVLTERGTYLKELKNDYEQASQYKELEKNIKRNKATYLNIQIKQKEEKLNKVTSSINNNQSQIDGINKKIEELKKSLQERAEEFKNLNLSIERSGEKSQKQLHREIEVLRNSLLEDKTRLSTIKSEIRSTSERKTQLSINLQDSDKKISSLEKEKSRIISELDLLKKDIEKKESNLDQIKKKYNFNDLEKEISSLEKEIDTLSSSGLQEKKLELLREKDKTELRLATIERVANKDQLNKLKDLKQKLKIASENLFKLNNQDSTYLNQLSSARVKIQKLSEEHSSLKTKKTLANESSINSLAVTKVKSLNMPGIYGTIAELAQVPQEYSTAAEVAAGARLHSVVVKDDKIASKCIEYLKRNRLGTAIFLPLNKLQNSKSSKINVSHGRILDLVKFDSKYKDAFFYVFGNTVIINNIEEARKIGIGKHRMVTLDGDLVELSGAMIGGFRSQRASSFLPVDIDKTIDALSRDIKNLKEFIADMEKKLSQNEAAISQAREEKSELEGEVIRMESLIGDIDNIQKEKTNLSNSLKDITSSILNIDSTLKNKSKTLEKLNKDRLKLKEKLEQQRNSRAMSQIESLETELKSLIEKRIILNSEIKNIDVQINDMILPEKDSISKIIKQQTEELESFNGEINQLSLILQDKEKQIKEKEKQESELYNNFKGLLNKRTKLNEFLQREEIRINNEENKTQLFHERINNLSLDKAKVVSEIQGLREEFNEFKDISLRKGLTESQLRDEMANFEIMLRKMGNVNLRALEIYNEVNKEYESLTVKSSKLKVEKEDVLKMIEEVESKKTAVFMKTFNQINKNFENIFTQLSMKGTSASLILENPEKPLEGGIYIMVKLAQNKHLDIKSLSGGEKTMTALAFIFAIQEHDPAPFYLLDEVDAALDKKNSEKLSELVNKYSSKAQYIVISHNDSIISGANKIYGVSMHKDGMSHVVSLKV